MPALFHSFEIFAQTEHIFGVVILLFYRFHRSTVMVHCSDLHSGIHDVLLLNKTTVNRQSIDSPIQCNAIQFEPESI